MVSFNQYQKLTGDQQVSYHHKRRITEQNKEFNTKYGRKLKYKNLNINNT